MNCSLQLMHGAYPASDCPPRCWELRDRTGQVQPLPLRMLLGFSWCPPPHPVHPPHTSGKPRRFHRILLSWDYYALCKRAEEGKGVYDTLRSVPNTFASIQVRRLAGSCSS